MEEAKHPSPYTLGIDLGTTSIKVAILDNMGVVVENVTVPSLAEVDSSEGEQGAEQSLTAIWSALQSGLRLLDTENQVKVQTIGVAGQMHGLVLWQQGKSWHSDNDQTRHIELQHTSHLYSWQDRRCSQPFLHSLPSPDSVLRLASGYGCATYLWLMRHQPDFLAQHQFDCAGTVMDFIVAAICDLERPVTSDQLAASFGYFNVQTRSWNSDILKSCGFPVSILPEVRKAGEVAGHLKQGLEHIPAGTPVLVAMGDMQCGVLSALHQPSDAILNISTSIQLSLPLDKDQSREGLGETVEVVPYFNDVGLAVMAGLNGGNTLTLLVSVVRQWLQELGVAGLQSDSAVFDRLLALAKKSPASDSLRISPTVFGERHCPDLLASVEGISPHNASLGSIFRAASEGIIDNIFRLLPPQVLVSRGVKRVIGSGSILTQNPLVWQRLEAVLEGKIDFVQGSESDAAFGAAKAALAFLHRCEKNGSSEPASLES